MTHVVNYYMILTEIYCNCILFDQTQSSSFCSCHILEIAIVHIERRQSLSFIIVHYRSSSSFIIAHQLGQRLDHRHHHGLAQRFQVASLLIDLCPSQQAEHAIGYDWPQSEMRVTLGSG
eukprot:g43658.t1